MNYHSTSQKGTFLTTQKSKGIKQSQVLLMYLAHVTRYDILFSVN